MPGLHHIPIGNLCTALGDPTTPATATHTSHHLPQLAPPLTTGVCVGHSAAQARNRHSMLRACCCPGNKQPAAPRHGSKHSNCCIHTIQLPSRHQPPPARPVPTLAARRCGLGQVLTPTTHPRLLQLPPTKPGHVYMQQQQRWQQASSASNKQAYRKPASCQGQHGFVCWQDHSSAKQSAAPHAGHPQYVKPQHIGAQQHRTGCPGGRAGETATCCRLHGKQPNLLVQVPCLPPQPTRGRGRCRPHPSTNHAGTHRASAAAAVPAPCCRCCIATQCDRCAHRPIADRPIADRPKGCGIGRPSTPCKASATALLLRRLRQL
jgi:hypothetical protein